MTGSRAAALVFLALALGGALAAAHSHDGDVTRRALESGFAYKAIGNMMIEREQTVFDEHGASGLAEYAVSNEGAASIKAVRASIGPHESRWLGSSERLLALHVAEAHLAEILGQLRGTWPSYSREMYDARTELERALITLSVTDGSPEVNAAMTARAAAQTVKLAGELATLREAATESNAIRSRALRDIAEVEEAARQKAEEHPGLPVRIVPSGSTTKIAN